MTAGLDVHRLEGGYGASRVLFGIDLRVDAGSMALLTGPNGAGKTTLLRAIAGTATTTAGTIEVAGTRIDGQSAGDRFRGGLAWVPEGRALFPGLTVRENLRVAARAWGIPRGEVDERMAAIVDRFEVVATKIDALVTTLSGGQQQLVAVARCFLARPQVLLLDEPSTGLSTIAWRSVLAACRSAADDGAAVLVVEQRLRDTIDHVDRVTVLVRGEVVHDAPASDPTVTPEGLSSAYFSAGRPR